MPRPPSVRSTWDSAVGRWRGLPASAQDVVIALAVAALALVPHQAGIGISFAEIAPHDGGAAGTVLLLAQALPLSVRRRRPLSCLALVGCAFAAYQLAGYPPTGSSYGLLIALYGMGAYLSRHRWVTVVAATTGYGALSVACVAAGSPETVSQFVAFFLVLGAFWGAGAGVRAWRHQEGERHQLAAEAAVAEDRSRLARELHDVVTHHVAAMVVQADAAQYLLADEAQRGAVENLGNIASTGRRALDELRGLLGVLSPSANEAPREPVASLSRVGDLVEQARRAGQPVEIRVTGQPFSVSAAADLAGYRVVQEGLTNALKHAKGRETTVEVSYGQEGLLVTVSNVGQATPAKPRCSDEPVAGGSELAAGDGPLAGCGRGLQGLRERVQQLGGGLTVQGRSGESFVLVARVPSRSVP